MVRLRLLLVPCLVLAYGPGVAAQALPTPSVAAVVVTPADESIAAGERRRYTATATFSSGSPRALASVPIAAGGAHSCALRVDGTVECWGDNALGQLGSGIVAGSSRPRPVPGLTGVTAITAGANHTCALLSGGTIACWGDNFRGQLGDGTHAGSFTPVAVAGIATATAVEAGGEHTCALLADRSVRCWGHGFAGQLGNGTGQGSNIPLEVVGIADAVAISAGSEHTCALRANGRLRCWGQNFFGQLGDGSNDSSDVPVAVQGLTNVVAVTTGDQHTCAVLADGGARCWGANALGRLGNGTPGDSSVPLAVSGVGTVRAIAAGDRHTCATLADGTVRCWGSSASGQIGDGSLGGGVFDTPVEVVGLTDTAAIAVGGEHACALSAAASIRCWGANGDGQLGISQDVGPQVCGVAAACSSRPVLAGSFGVAMASIARHSCAVLKNGTVSCWGYNEFGQLGNGTTSDSPVPVAVSGITNAIAVSTGGLHTCAVLADGQISCWGRNEYGQLGVGSIANSSLPLAVSGIANATAVSAGGVHTCALLSTGAVQCWGSNRLGHLGSGGTNGPESCGVDGGGDGIACSTTPVSVVGIAGARAVSAGGSHACALLTNGALYCWGNNTRQALGNPHEDACASYTVAACSAVPLPVIGIATATSISAGFEHSCATLADGTARCWGNNGAGQLGNGGGSGTVYTPQVVTGLSDAVEISAGYFHSCARLGDGGLRCWGQNAGGFGNGGTANSSTPVAVNDIAAVSVSAGLNSSCAIGGEGVVRCWGQNLFGQVGDGTSSPVLAPARVVGFFDSIAAVVWSSLDPAVALIAPDGLVTGLGEGTTTIGAAAANFGVSGGTTLEVPEPGGALATAAATSSLAWLATRRRATRPHALTPRSPAPAGPVMR